MRTILLLLTLLVPALASCGSKVPARQSSGFCSPDLAAVQQAASTGAVTCELAGK